MRSQHQATLCDTPCQERNRVDCHCAPTGSISSMSSAPPWSQFRLHQRGSKILTPFLDWAQPEQGWIFCLPPQLFPPPLGRQGSCSSLPTQTEGKPGATLQFNDKGTAGRRSTPVKDACVLGSIMKEDPELNLALLTFWPGLWNG